MKKEGRGREITIQRREERTGGQFSAVERGRKRGSKHEVRKDVKGGVC